MGAVEGPLLSNPTPWQQDSFKSLPAWQPLLQLRARGERCSPDLGPRITKQSSCEPTPLCKKRSGSPAMPPRYSETGGRQLRAEPAFKTLENRGGNWHGARVNSSNELPHGKERHTLILQQTFGGIMESVSQLSALRHALATKTKVLQQRVITSHARAHDVTWLSRNLLS